MTSVYAFASVDFIFTHPAQGQYSAQGEGLGDITITMTNDVSAHNLASDGSVMISRIEAKNATITMTIQQTSAMNRWLERLYNYLQTAPNDQWAAASIVLNDRLNNDRTTCTGVSFQKRPDLSYQQQGQQRSWTLMAATVEKQIA